MPQGEASKLAWLPLPSGTVLHPPVTEEDAVCPRMMAWLGVRGSHLSWGRPRNGIPPIVGAAREEVGIPPIVGAAPDGIPPSVGAARIFVDVHTLKKLAVKILQQRWYTPISTLPISQRAFRHTVAVTDHRCLGPAGCG